MHVEPLPEGKYLVLIPHSDDEWIGCGTIIQDGKYDVVLCNMNMPGGDSIDIHVTRRNEMNNIAQMFNRKLVTCDEDTELYNIITNEKPKGIVIPYIYDWHEEHFFVMNRLSKVLSILNFPCNVVMSQITVPIAYYNITHANKMNKKSWKHKWSIFRNNYRTQKYFPWYRLSCHERLNGEIFGWFSSEVFCVMKSDKWLEVFFKSRPTEDERQQIKERISSLQLVREFKQARFYDGN